MHVDPVKMNRLIGVILIISVFASCRKDKTEPANNNILQLVSVKVGIIYLTTTGENTDIPVDHPVIVAFSSVLDTGLVRDNISLTGETTGNTSIGISYLDDLKTVVLMPNAQLKNNEKYTLSIADGLKGKNGETFPGISYHFTTVPSNVVINKITVNGQNLTATIPLMNIDRSKATIDVQFAEALDPADYTAYFALSGGAAINYSISPDSTQVELSTTGMLKGWSRYYLTISDELTTPAGSGFGGFVALRTV